MKSKAKLYIDKRIDQLNGSILEIIIWKLPTPTAERPHGYKYRLNYSLPDGTTLLRYDNELGKGDHLHIKGKEYPYKFMGGLYDRKEASQENNTCDD
jgi:hypothetical protein